MSGSHLLLRQTRGARGRGEHGSGGRVETGYALWSSFISDNGRTVDSSFHVHRRRTDGMRQTFVTRMQHHAAAMIDPHPNGSRGVTENGKRLTQRWT